MCCLPHCQEVVLQYFHYPDSPYGVALFHSVISTELYRPARLSEFDDYLRAALYDVNVRRAVLAGREEDSDREAFRPDDGWQLRLTQRLGVGNCRDRLTAGRLA